MIGGWDAVSCGGPSDLAPFFTAFQQQGFMPPTFPPPPTVTGVDDGYALWQMAVAGDGAAPEVFAQPPMPVEALLPAPHPVQQPSCVGVPIAEIGEKKKRRSRRTAKRQSRAAQLRMARLLEETAARGRAAQQRETRGGRRSASLSAAASAAGGRPVRCRSAPPSAAAPAAKPSQLTPVSSAADLGTDADSLESAASFVSSVGHDDRAGAASPSTQGSYEDSCRGTRCGARTASPYAFDSRLPMSPSPREKQAEVPQPFLDMMMAALQS